jgi:hypothetical protein
MGNGVYDTKLVYESKFAIPLFALHGVAFF